LSSQQSDTPIYPPYINFARKLVNYSPLHYTAQPTPFQPTKLVPHPHNHPSRPKPTIKRLQTLNILPIAPCHRLIKLLRIGVHKPWRAVRHLGADLRILDRVDIARVCGPAPDACDVVMHKWAFVRHSEAKGGDAAKLDIFGARHALGPKRQRFAHHRGLNAVDQIARLLALQADRHLFNRLHQRTRDLV